ncbi:hypothetical protein [Hymenobacter negativus]|uniref:T9SS type A sorting domain-containing protein n=1 Tax=Hymenobacter negativus TaxID=2795026 RepID=A0ABS3QMI5_9BACT|nr:hypothetical protein [Hymenobacter negativus]MBO2012478.1 hypothetical protein [Hymenobacter negativus]
MTDPVGNLSRLRGFSRPNYGGYEPAALGTFLKQVDWDGTFAYLPVCIVALTPLLSHTVTISPNPAHGGAVMLTGTAPGTLITVLDALGRPVTTAIYDAAGTAPLALPTRVYVVRAGSKASRLAVE